MNNPPVFADGTLNTRDLGEVVMNARFEHNGLNYEFEQPLVKRPEDGLIGPPISITYRDMGNHIEFDLTLAGIQENHVYYSVEHAHYFKSQ